MRLRRERVVDVAIALVDADGLDALTMRKLATRLGVQAGALYWHFAGNRPSRRDGRPVPGRLRRRSAGRVVGRATRGRGLAAAPGAPVPPRWRQGHGRHLRCRAQHRPARQHGHRDPPGLRAAARRAGWAAFAAFHYVLGHTIEEQAQIELTERGVWEPKLTVDGIENKLAATAFTADPAERFGYGLQLFLDGIRQQLALLPSGRPGSRPGSRQTHRKPARRAERTVPGPAPRQREVSSPVAAAAGRHRPLEDGTACARPVLHVSIPRGRSSASSRAGGGAVILLVRGSGSARRPVRRPRCGWPRRACPARGPHAS